MNIYKLRIEHTAAKTISKESFEEETRCREPWYQDGSGNRPWIFAYLSDATDLFGQKVTGNIALSKAISDHAPEARIENGRVLSMSRPGEKCFCRSEDKLHSTPHYQGYRRDELVETMALVVSRQEKRELINIHNEVIEFDQNWFERLIQLPPDHQNRKMGRVTLAREVLGSLL
ncbi:hypothetical protein [Janthinobacterium sp. HH104]|uniref:hypothetical protein n=1 Tax=Janthinobacterium sp. HH104 TaxID=1537276 RepID=UPI001C302387|nr:hypothetical protein [Janthinobacterium sp. HH104]